MPLAMRQIPQVTADVQQVVMFTCAHTTEMATCYQDIHEEASPVTCTHTIRMPPPYQRMHGVASPLKGVHEDTHVQAAEVLREGNHAEGVQSQAQRIALHALVLLCEVAQVRDIRLQTAHSGVRAMILGRRQTFKQQPWQRRACLALSIPCDMQHSSHLNTLL